MNMTSILGNLTPNVLPGQSYGENTQQNFNTILQQLMSSPQFASRRPMQTMQPMSRAQPSLSGGFNDQAQRLARGETSPMYASPENREGINAMFRQYLGRQATPNGAGYWSSVMDQKGPEAVREAISASPEAMINRNRQMQMQRLLELRNAFGGLNRGA